MNTDYKNLNNTYYENLDENFNQAIKLFETDISHSDLINLLKTGNILQKQIAVLKINTVINTEDAEIIVKNLIGQDGKIREAVSLKLLELIPQYSDLFKAEIIYDIFLEAIIDVNPNICRNLIETIKYLKKDKNFINYFIPKLVNKTNEYIEKIKKIDFQEGKYKINKEVFKLYWCLENIYELTDYIEIETIKSIIKETMNINEYTIREKSAKILSKNFEDTECTKMQSILKQDSNYYVRRF